MKAHSLFSQNFPEVGENERYVLHGLLFSSL